MRYEEVGAFWGTMSLYHTDSFVKEWEFLPFRLDWVSEERTAEDRKMLSQALIICGFLVLYNVANLLAMTFQNVGWVSEFNLESYKSFP